MTSWATYNQQQSNTKAEKEIKRLINAAPLTPAQHRKLVKLLRESGNYTEDEITYMVNYIR